MPRKIRLEHDYAAAAERVWEVAVDWGAWAESMRGVAKIRGLPEGPPFLGQSFQAEISMLGLGPWSPWRIEIVAYDPEARTVRSIESGGPVRRWDHRLSVEPIASGARLIDEIEIEAGWLSGVFAFAGRRLYAMRHKPRLRMLGLAP